MDNTKALQQILHRQQETQTLIAGVFGNGGILPEVLGELNKINVHLARVNGTLGATAGQAKRNTDKLTHLPCADHKVKLALLGQGQTTSKTNWGRVTSIILAIVQAVTIAGMLYAAGLK